MKNIIFTFVTGIFLSVASSAQTAVNFNCNKCGMYLEKIK